MTYTLELLPGEPIALLKLVDPFDFQQEPRQINEELITLLKEMEGNLFLICDALELSFNFSDLVMGLAATFRSDLPADIDRKQFGTRLRTIAVGTSGLLKLAIDSVRQDQYGGWRFLRVDTVEEALARAREEIAATSGG